jgi:hypothetical protein
VVLTAAADALTPLLPVPELLDVDCPFSVAVRLSSAAVSVACACCRVSRAEEESSVAISCPFTRCPTLRSTLFSVPLVAKFTSSSVLGSTLPVPDTVVCTTPSAAVTSSVEVRAELAGVPSSPIPSATTTIAITPNR